MIPTRLQFGSHDLDLDLSREVDSDFIFIFVFIAAKTLSPLAAPHHTFKMWYDDCVGTLVRVLFGDGPVARTFPWILCIYVAFTSWSVFYDLACKWFSSLPSPVFVGHECYHLSRWLQQYNCEKMKHDLHASPVGDIP